MISSTQTDILSPDNFDVEVSLSQLRRSFPEHYLQIIKPALTFIREKQTANIPDTVLAQSIAMSNILLGLQTEPETIISALLLPYLNQAYLTLDEVSEQFDPTITKILTNLLKINDFHLSNESHNNQTNLQSQVNNLRKMVLAIIEDIRVVLIKLAEQTWLIRKICAQKERTLKDTQIAYDIMNIYAPLASRLGIGQLKWELEDLAFRMVTPDEYKSIARSLDSKRTDRENYVQQIMTIITTELHQAGLKNFEIMGRAKHIYSIHNKMKRKSVDFDQIYDAIAIRVLTHNIETCYATLSCVHQLWPQIPQEFDDYISHPKGNGYRSIHTAVKGPDNKNIEIQIRTFEMHEESELGFAAHWKYKENANTEQQFEQKITWLRQVIEWQRDLAQHQLGKDNSDIQKLFNDRVYVFSPAGKIIDLPYGATPIDFAYAIHTQIGHRCRGAKVNNTIVPLNYRLNSGEYIEILTMKEPGPSRDWLANSAGYVHTEKAQKRISHWFKQQDAGIHIQDGRNTLERELKQHHLQGIDLLKLAKQLKCPTVQALCLQINHGEIRINTVLQAAEKLLNRNQEKPSHAKPNEEKLTQLAGKITQDRQNMTVSNSTGILSFTARCCKPVPGDEVIGYISQGRGIMIHRKTCPNLTNMPNQDRLIEIDFSKKESVHPCDLIIKALDKNDLLKSLTALLSTEKTRLIRLSNSRQQQYIIIYLCIEIENRDKLASIMKKIKDLPSILTVDRKYL